MGVTGKLYHKSDFNRAAKIQKSKNSEPYRTAFRRDYARLIHCPSFRRLQGKTQVFPGNESDFFRNRMSHSLEVAQIAKSIAIRLNEKSRYFKNKNQKIDTDLIEFAGLAHDLGHPPFGHNGEAALDECMLDDGGFEGNAQTLRILSRLEKKETKRLVNGAMKPIDGDHDVRCGLNLSYRSLAAILKYDRMIPHRRIDRDGGKLVKGYYHDDLELVGDIKNNVLGVDTFDGNFKTIECSIMDVADDIAYSTYDLEDTFKAFFATPMFLFVLDDHILQSVATTTKERIDKAFPEFSETDRSFGSITDVMIILSDIFEFVFGTDDFDEAVLRDKNLLSAGKKMFLSIQASEISRRVAADGYERTKFTSALVERFIRGIEVVSHKAYPQLHSVRLGYETFVEVEVLKNLVFQSIIMSSGMQVVEYRGKDIVKKIFSAIESGGHHLLPDDFRGLYRSLAGSAKRRVICDFIAGMTDRYAIEFYSRLYGASPQSIHKPI